MDFAGHLKTGLATSTICTGVHGIATAYTGDSQNPKILLITFFACLIGSLISDLDTHSTPSRIFSFILMVFGAYSIYTKEPYFALAILTGFAFIKSMRHRGWCHAFSLPLALSIFAFSSGYYLLIPFSVGILTHFWADSLHPLKLSNWYKPYIF